MRQAMRAAQITRVGGPELEIVDVPTPTPGPGQLL
jgi:NADPH:quinone reductase-like Zn-dependent oxidoreductase